MITIRKKGDGFFDEVYGEFTIRHYGYTKIKGYLSSINSTPQDKDFSDILNLDIVITKLPTMLAGSKFNFDYQDGDRLATRMGCGFGEYRHIHLMVNQHQANQLLHLIHKKVEVVGDEIAVMQKGNGSIFWVDESAPVLMGLSTDHQLTTEIRARCVRNKKLNRTSCHSVRPIEINQTGFFYKEKGCQMGSKMNGEFTQAAAGIAGYGGAIARQSMKKSREAGKAGFAGSEVGKNKAAADQVDMRQRVKKLEEK
jgi:hypothetical protein